MARSPLTKSARFTTESSPIGANSDGHRAAPPVTVPVAEDETLMGTGNENAPTWITETSDQSTKKRFGQAEGRQPEAAREAIIH